MHWKVKALSGIMVINLALLLSIGMWLLVNRQADEDEPDPKVESPSPAPAAVPEEVPPLPPPEEVKADN